MLRSAGWGEVVGGLEDWVNQPAVSRHLKKQDEAGLDRTRREGRQHFYTLDQEHLARCCGQRVTRFAPEVESPGE